MHNNNLAKINKKFNEKCSLSTINPFFLFNILFLTQPWCLLLMKALHFHFLSSNWPRVKLLSMRGWNLVEINGQFTQPQIKQKKILAIVNKSLGMRKKWGITLWWLRSEWQTDRKKVSDLSQSWYFVLMFGSRFFLEIMQFYLKIEFFWSKKRDFS